MIWYGDRNNKEYTLDVCKQVVENMQEYAAPSLTTHLQSSSGFGVPIFIWYAFRSKYIINVCL